MKQTKVGMVGLGYAGQGIHGAALEALPESFEIVAACDIDEQRRRKLSERWRARPYDKLSTLLTDKEVELVVITTKPYAAHVDQAIEALATGKHVVIDKPVALTLADARRLKAVADRAAGRLFPHHNQRWNVAYQCFCEALEAGVVGELRLIELRKQVGATGGDMFFDFGSHWTDMVVGLTKGRRLREVSGMVQNPAGALPELGFFTGTLRYEDGLVVEIKFLPNSLPDQAQFWYAAGTKGGYQQDWFDVPDDLFRKQARETATDPTRRRFVPSRFAVIDRADGNRILTEVLTTGFYRQLDRVLHGPEQPLVTVDDIVAQLQILEAIIESARTKRTVNIQD